MSVEGDDVVQSTTRATEMSVTIEISPRRSNILFSAYFRYTERYTVDAIATTALGLKVEPFRDQDSPFVTMAQKLFDYLEYNTGYAIICEFDTCVQNVFRKLFLQQSHKSALREQENVYNFLQIIASFTSKPKKKEQRCQKEILHWQ